MWSLQLESKANSVLCVQCGDWVHGRKWSAKGDSKVLRNCACKKCEGNIREAVEQEDNICDEVQTAREFPYLGDRVSADGVCEAAVIARTRCG